MNEATKENLVAHLQEAFLIAGALHVQTKSPIYAQVKLRLKEATANVDQKTSQEMAGLISMHSGGGVERTGSFVKSPEEIADFFKKKPKAANVEEINALPADEETGEGGEGEGEGTPAPDTVTDIPALVRQLKETPLSTQQLASSHTADLGALAAALGIEVEEKWNTMQKAAAIKRELEK